MLFLSPGPGRYVRFWRKADMPVECPMVA